MPHRFGWCLDGHHERCPVSFKSTQTGKTYECSCKCHQDREKMMEELL